MLAPTNTARVEFIRSIRAGMPDKSAESIALDTALEVIEQLNKWAQQVANQKVNA